MSGMWYQSDDGRPRLTQHLTEGDEQVLEYVLGAGRYAQVRMAKKPVMAGYPDEASDTVLPLSFVVTIVEPDIPYAVTVSMAYTPGRSPKCMALTVAPRGIQHAPVISGGPHDREVFQEHEPITAEALRRVPVARVIQKAVRAAVHDTDGPAGEIAYFADPADLAVTDGPRTKRGKQLDDTHYRQVADVYRKALAAGTAPTKSVAAWGSVSHSSAARWVMEARRRGHLEPA